MCFSLMCMKARKLVLYLFYFVSSLHNTVASLKSIINTKPLLTLFIISTTTMDVIYSLFLPGEMAFNDGHYDTALKLYQQLREQLKHCGINYCPKTEIQIAKCLYKLNLKDEAKKNLCFIDSIAAVHADFKLLFELGKAFVFINEKERAFLIFVHILEMRMVFSIDGIVSMIDLISEIMMINPNPVVFTNDPFWFPANDWNEILLRVSKQNGWKQINSHWPFFRDLSAKKPYLNASRISLESLFKISESELATWGQDLAVRLLFCGADVNTIPVSANDTLLHKALRLTLCEALKAGSNKSLNTELLKYLLKNVFKSPENLNITDKNGNNILHLLTIHSDQLDNANFSQLLSTFLELGLSCSRRNMNKKLPLDYINQKRHPKSYTLVLETLEGQPDIPYIMNVLQKKCYKKSLQLMDNYILKNPTRNHIPIVDLIVNKVLPNIANDLSKIKVNLTTDIWSAIIQQLIAANNWLLIEKLLCDGGNGIKKEKGGIATGADLTFVSLLKLLKDDQIKFCNKNLFLEQLIKNKAPVDGLFGENIKPLEYCLIVKNYRAMVPLLESGANYSFLSISPGDTPLHAVLDIEMNVKRCKKDCYKILKILLNLFKDNPEKHQDLNPCRQDKNGNTLFHIICQHPSSGHAKEGAKLIKNFVNPVIQNNDSKSAFDYISENDSRYNFLKMAQDLFSPENAKENVNIPVVEGDEINNQKEDNEIFNVIIKTEMQVIAEYSPKVLLANSFEKTKKETSTKLTNATDKSQMISKHMSMKKILDDIMENITQLKKLPSKKKTKLSPENSVHNHETKQIIANIIDCKNNCYPPLEYNKSKFENEEYQNIDVDKFEWEVECTSIVWKMLASEKLTFRCKKEIIDNIVLIANGDWIASTKINLEEHDIKLYEILLSNGIRIIWEKVVVFSPRCSNNCGQILGHHSSNNSGQIYSDVIRIWAIILDSEEIEHHIKMVTTSYYKGKNCLLQKKLKNIQTFVQSKDTNIPEYFCEIDDFGKNNKSSTSEYFNLLPATSTEESDYHLMKFYTFSTHLVRTVLGENKPSIEFPFRVTELEHSIIQLKVTQAIILVGRSGTGKTTCCVYRLWSQFVQYWQKYSKIGDPLIPRKPIFRQPEDKLVHSLDFESEVVLANCNDVDCIQAEAENNSDSETVDIIYEHLHQVFVTKNSVLCKEVKRNFKGLSQTCEEAKEHLAVQDDALPTCFQNVHPAAFPLFLTSKQLLILLDASLPNPYFERNDNGSLKQKIYGWGEDEEDELSLLIEVDYESEEWLMEDEVLPANDSTSIQEVTYDYFAFQIWPKIKKGLKYHPSLVWMEIVSFIKGSAEALHTEKGHLSKEVYNELGCRHAPNFCGDRNEIYNIFERYRRFNQMHHLFDESDVVFHIFQRLKNMSSPDWTLHEIYIDETQDFTQAELSLLICCCQDPNKMFFTGDTAQSIVRGITFRFCDLRSLFYQAAEAFKAIGKSGIITIPQNIYQLSHNYRSHAGILSLASSIIDLLTYFFPDSFDHLEKDLGLFPGPKPILLELCSFAELAVLLQGNLRETCKIEFGAHQVILVANDEAKDNIPIELSSNLVLTIFEAKGLEFDDVLLFNFFKDSQASKEWNIVLSCCQPENLNAKDGSINSLKMTKIPEIAQKFTVESHKILNSELKRLYTALTRARVNIWIFDEDPVKRKPMFEYFKIRQLVKIFTEEQLFETSDSSDAVFAVQSSEAQWITQGDYFFNHKLFNVAAICYKKGGELSKMMLAEAYFHASNAQIISTTHNQTDEFLKASRLFLKLGKHEEAINCLVKARKYELSAKLCEKVGELSKAAALYKKIKQNANAVRCYHEDLNYEKAVEILVLEKNYEKAINYIEDYQNHVKSNEEDYLKPPKAIHCLEDLSYSGAIFYDEQKNEEKKMKFISKLPLKTKLLFLKERKYFKEAMMVYIEEGMYLEAAQIGYKNGYLEEAFDCLFKAINNETVAKLSIQICKTLINKNVDKMQTPYTLKDYKNLNYSTITPDLLSKMEHCVENAVEVLRRTNDLISLSEGLLLLSILPGECKEDESLLLKSMDLFIKDNHPAAALFMAEMLFRSFGLKLNNYEKILVVLQLTLKFLQNLNKSNNLRNVQTEFLLGKCLEFYGLKTSNDNKYWTQVSHNESCFNHLICDTDISVIEGNLKLFEKFYNFQQQIITKLYDFLIYRIQFFKECSECILNLPCAQMKSHIELDNKEKYKILLKLVGSSIELKQTVIEYKDIINTSEDESDSLKFTILEADVSCELYSLIIPTFRYSIAMPHTWQEIVIMLRTTGILKPLVLQHLMVKLKKDMKIINPHHNSTDFFIKAYITFQLAKENTKDLEIWLHNTSLQQKEIFYSKEWTNPEKINPKSAMLYFNDPPNNSWEYFNIMHRLNNALSHLFQSGDVKTAFSEFISFISIVAKKKLPVIPNIANTCLLLEIFTVLYFKIICYAKPPKYVCLPLSYLQLVSFFEGIHWGSCTMNSIVKSQNWDADSLKQIESYMVKLITILSGGFKNFDVIGDSFCSALDECERTICLVLVLLRNGYSFKEYSIKKLIERLKNLAIPDFPPRVIEIFKELDPFIDYQKRTIIECQQIFKNYMHSRNDSLCYISKENIDIELNKNSYEKIDVSYSYNEQHFLDGNYDDDQNISTTLHAEEMVSVKEQKSLIALKKCSLTNHRWYLLYCITKVYIRLKRKRSLKQSEGTDIVIDPDMLIFSKYTIDNTMCSICDVLFAHNDNVSFTEVDQTVEFSADRFMKNSLLRKEHEESSNHKENCESFQKFYNFYKNELNPFLKDATRSLNYLKKINVNSVTLKSNVDSLKNKVAVILKNLTWQDIPHIDPNLKEMVMSNIKEMQMHEKERTPIFKSGENEDDDESLLIDDVINLGDEDNIVLNRYNKRKKYQSRKNKRK